MRMNLSGLTQAWRALRHSPLHALALVLCLSLGIGATTALFGVLDQTVFRKPHPGYDRMVIFGADKPPSGFISNSYLGQILPCMSHAKSFEAFAVCGWGRGSMQTREGTFGIDFGYVNPGYFTFLGAQMELGRDFQPWEYRADIGEALIITHGCWKDVFQQDPAILGRTVTLEGRACTIVGVLSRHFLPPPQVWSQVYRPFLPTLNPAKPGRPPLATLARLRPGATLAQANAEVSTLAAQAPLPPRQQQMFKEHPLTLKRLSDEDPRTHLGKLHGAFMAGIGSLFAIALLGSVNLMSMRLARRRHELVVRRAMGASVWDLMGRVGLESLGLAGLSALLSVGIARLLMKAILGALTGSVASESPVHLDGRALAFTLGITLLASLGVALLPLLRMLRSELQTHLMEGRQSLDEAPRQRRFREILVILSVAFSMVLLTGTGLMTRSVQRLLKVNRGFDPRGKLAYWVDVPPQKRTQDAYLPLASALETRLQALPGIRSVSTTNTLPMAGTSSANLKKPDGTAVVVGPHPISAGFARALGLKLLKGRWIPEQRTPEKVVVFNRSMARLWFGELDPIGRAFQMESEPWTVIGLVDDVRDTPRSKGEPEFYYPAWQEDAPSDVISLLIDVSVKPTPALLQAIRNAVREVDGSLGLRPPIGLEEAAQKQVDAERFTLKLLQLISALSLTLALLGTFAVMSFSTTQRLRSCGIRSALGARPFELLRSVLLRGLALTGLGIGLGLFAAWGLTRFIRSLLFEVSPMDPASYLGAALFMLLSTLLACLPAALRAAKADPAHLLRSE